MLSRILVIVILIPAISFTQQIDTLKYNFKKYSVQVDSPKTAPLNWSSNPSAKRFRTVISDEIKQGVNFAGHFRIIQWGCGTQCQSWVIVDVRTGKIYDGIPTCRGQQYYADSRLIILDPVVGDEPDPICEPPSVYEWKNNKLQLLQKVKND